MVVVVVLVVVVGVVESPELYHCRIPNSGISSTPDQVLSARNAV